MSEPTQHRPPTPPQPNTVADQPATAEAAAADWASRRDATGIHPSSYDATPHTHGRKS